MLLTICVATAAIAQPPISEEPLPGIDPAVQPAQFAPPPPLQGPQMVPPPAPSPASRASFRRIQFFPRNGAGFNQDSARTGPNEFAIIVEGGVNVVIQGLTVEGLPDVFGPIGDVDIETDRAVIWLAGTGLQDMSQLTQQSDMPLEIYMEGNIVFRQGDRTVYADRMFYDARRQVGIILNAELLTPVPPTGDFNYEGLVRLRAAAVRQLDQSRFVAQDAMITTSRLEEPSYSFSSETLTFRDTAVPAIDPATGAPVVNIVTGQPVVDHQQLVEGQNNYVNVAGVPVLYWPTIATDLDNPSYYVSSARIRNDSIFGFQTLFELDAFQIFGMERPPGVKWNLDLDYLSERGLGYGTNVEYARDNFFDIPGPTRGQLDAWFIRDNGKDNIGLGRRNIVPEKRFRGRTFWNHRQHLVGGLLDDWTVQGEVGWLSDRTFLEQYYESEWDNDRIPGNGARIKRSYDNQSISLEANARINDFFTETQWLPRLDHYWLGQPLIDDQLTWFEHSQAAFANIGIASPPTNPTLLSQWTLLPWEVDAAGNPIRGRGERLVTRQELDYPIDLAPFKVVPYALGEIAHWGADLNGNDIQRAYGQFGVRASIPFWAVDPSVRDILFNLNGLAHKVVFDVEASYADSTQNLDEFPLYDPLDDTSIVEFHRQLFFSPFGGNLLPQYYLLGPPPFINQKFDPRFYALRTGLQGWVTSPSTEIADDLMVVRMGMRHRLQTKRGPIGHERIIDWMTFDANAVYFPDANRDNSGADFGLIDYDFKWHIGDRFSILSDGYADTFGDGLRTVSIGARLNRPASGNAYLGFRALKGIIDSNIVMGTVNYRMTPKWIGSAGASLALNDTGNINQSFAVTRIGESLLVTVGGHYNQSQDNLGVSFLVEPRFLPNNSVIRKTGIDIPPIGAYGLE
jgi:hypothetical protein